jgi:hypothetical protein
VAEICLLALSVGFSSDVTNQANGIAVCTKAQYIIRQILMNLRFVVPCVFNHSNKITNKMQGLLMMGIVMPETC